MSIKGPRCQVCEHPDRASIELGLGNNVPVRVLGKRYNVHHDAVHRHSRNHMTAELHAQLISRGRMTPLDLENLKVTESEGVLQHLVSLRARLFCLMDAAQEQGDIKAAATVATGLHKNLELIGKLLGDLRTGSVSITQNLLVAPEFFALRTSIMQALRAHPAARADVVKALQHFQSPDLPAAETEDEREAAAPELAKARDVTRRSRAKAIEGESRRVVAGS